MSIVRETIMSLVETAGLPITDQTAWTRVGDGTHRVYVARTKKVARVNLAGARFAELQIPGVRVLPEDERFCTVTAELDFSQPEDVLLAALGHCLMLARELPQEKEKKAAPPKKERKAKEASAAGTEEAARAAPKKRLTPEEQAERKAKIAAAALARREAKAKDAPKPQPKEDDLVVASSPPEVGDLALESGIQLTE